MKYPKMQTLWKRDEKNKFVIIPGKYSKQEFAVIERWLVTEKVHGTNIRVIYDGEEVEFRGRTDKAEIPSFLSDYMERKITKPKLQKIFTKLEPGEIITLYGEGYGKKIQKVGSKYRNDVGFILFDVYTEGWWLKREAIEGIAKELDIMAVPILGIWDTETIIDFVKRGAKSTISKDDLIMEGVVARSYPLMLFRNRDPLMWKLKHVDFLKLESIKEQEVKKND